MIKMEEKLLEILVNIIFILITTLTTLVGGILVYFAKALQKSNKILENNTEIIKDIKHLIELEQNHRKKIEQEIEYIKLQITNEKGE